MTFPSSHVPANLTKLSFTGPFSHVPVNLGVDDSAPPVEICWDRWQDQQSHRLHIEFNDEWEYQEPDALQISWLCANEICLGKWEEWQGNQINFDFTHDQWTSVPGNEVDFDFDCYTDDGECTTLWTEYQGNQVPIAFNKPWLEYQGNQVPIAFECDGEGGGGDEFTYFTGYLDVGEGATLDANFEVTWISNVYAGEEFSAKLNDFTEETFNDLDFRDGAWIGGTTCGQPIPVLLQGYLSSGATTTASDNNGTIQITGSSSGRYGGNLTVSDVLEAPGHVEISWASDLSPAQWYDNDNTDAVIRFELFLADDLESLSRPTNAWTYSDPSRMDSPPVITWWQPFGTQRDGEVRYKSSGTGLGTLAFTTNTASLNLHEGDKRLRFVYRPLETSIEVDVYVDDTLVGSGEIPLEPIGYVIPLWHYHNYTRVDPVYSVDSVEIIGCGEFLTTFPMQGFGVIDMREGAELDFALRTEMVIPMEFFSGETLEDLYLGSDVEFEDVEFHSGEFSGFDLTLNLPWEITANAYDGASATAELNTTTTLDFEFFSDATLQVQLTEAEFWQFFEGATFEFDLEIFPGDNFGSIDLFDGAVLEGELATTHSLPVNIFSGETLHDLYLATDVYLDGVDFFSGESASFDLTLNLPWEISANVYDGAEASIFINTADTMRPLAYSGEYVEFDLDLRPMEDLLLNAYDGASVEADISTAVSLGDIRAYEGAQVSLDLDSDEFWVFYEGAWAGLDLATETTMPANAYSGESVAMQLETRPSEGLGTFRAYDGAYLDAVVQVMVSAILYPNRIRAGFEYTTEFDINTSFDLNNTSCCPVKDSHERIELTDQPPPDEYYHGDKWLFTVELSALPRFQMEAYSGEHFFGDDPVILGEFQAFEGQAVTVTHLNEEFTDFRLCYGNFIPDGDQANVELVSVYDDDCEAHHIYEGASARFELENNVRHVVNMYTGAYMAFDLYIEPEMLLRAWSGEFVRISNPEFVLGAFEGAMATIQFEEKDWRFYEGAAMELPTLTTEYDVEFLERGCLENEFVPSNEHGDPDWDRFNPVPVELEQYVHSIKARCW